MMASLRLATADDADTIAHLCRELLAFYGIPPPYSRWAMAEAIKEQGLKDGRLEVLLAERDGVAVGLLDRKSTRLNSSHVSESRMPSSA